MKLLRILSAVLLASVLSTAVARSGVYNVFICNNPATENWCIPTQTLLTNDDVNPTGRVHPLGFDGSGGAYTISVCVDDTTIPTSVLESVIGPGVKSVLTTWNELVPTTGNCSGDCFQFEDNARGSSDEFSFESVLLHEVGHCAFGLDHPNLEADVTDDIGNERVPTSYTNQYDGSTALLSAGEDTVRGSADDGFGSNPTDIHWFRISDNNPVIIDSTVIDSTTYSRSQATHLGDDFPANANRDVAELLGFPPLPSTEPFTRAVMYSALAAGNEILTLSADEVNMVKNLLTGSDRAVGNADDYTVSLEFVSDCAAADIKVSLFPFGEDPPSTLGGCTASVDFAFAQTPIIADDYVVVKDLGSSHLEIFLNNDFNWNFNTPFIDGFESGNTSEWDDTDP